MKLPVEKLNTKKFTIGQEVLMVKHLEGDIEIKKKALVIAITDKSLIVKAENEFIFTETTLSLNGEYVLFSNIEEYKQFVQMYNKFKTTKQILMNEIGELTDGLTVEDLQDLIKLVKDVKCVKENHQEQMQGHNPLGFETLEKQGFRPVDSIYDVFNLLAGHELLNSIPKEIKIVKFPKE